MRLSVPIYRLKRRARVLSREARIPLSQALDRVASEEGFASWSLLAAKASTDAPSRALLAQLTPGDLVLLGARPGHGKTVMGLELIANAVTCGRRGFFFTLEYNDTDVLGHFRSIGGDAAGLSEKVEFYNSDDISADYIIDRLVDAPRGAVVVIDYLQLLDQKRANPDLIDQVRALKTFAREKGLIVVFISQIDRSYERSDRSIPELADVRLPNPMNLTLFTKTCFLHDGEVRIKAA